MWKCLRKSSCAACCRQGPAACEALPPRRYLHALVFPAACHKLWEAASEAASGLPHFRRMPALHDAGQGVQHDLYDLNETRGVDAPRVQENCPKRVGQLDSLPHVFFQLRDRYDQVESGMSVAVVSHIVPKGR